MRERAADNDIALRACGCGREAEGLVGGENKIPPAQRSWWTCPMQPQVCDRGQCVDKQANRQRGCAHAQTPHQQCSSESDASKRQDLSNAAAGVN